MRGDQISRQWRLLQTLADRVDGQTAQRLADDMGVSVRTVYRDLDVLERVGIPLVQDREGRQVRWRLMEPRRLRLGPVLSEEELASVYAARVVLADAGSPWLASFDRAVAKAEAMVPLRVVTDARARAQPEESEAASALGSHVGEQGGRL